MFSNLDDDFVDAKDLVKLIKHYGHEQILIGRLDDTQDWSLFVLDTNSPSGFRMLRPDGDYAGKPYLFLSELIRDSVKEITPEEPKDTRPHDFGKILTFKRSEIEHKYEDSIDYNKKIENIGKKRGEKIKDIISGCSICKKGDENV